MIAKIIPAKNIKAIPVVAPIMIGEVVAIIQDR